METDPSSVYNFYRAIPIETYEQLQKLLQVKVSVNVEKPTKDQLRLVFLNSAIPFIGFGFIDNVIMILAGDLIDVKLGVVMGISTIAAAGLGNLVSDM